MHPEVSGNYPDEVRESEAKRALYDFFGRDVDKALSIDQSIRSSLSTNWKDNLQKQKKIKLAIYENLSLYGYGDDEKYSKVEEIYSMIERQEEYDM